MKQMRKIGLMITVFMLLFQVVSFANEDEIIVAEKELKTTETTENLSKEYDQRNMTFEERAKWVDQNVKPTFSGHALKNAKGEWLYTNLYTTVAENDFYALRQLESKIKFMCNDDFTRVDSYSYVEFRTPTFKQGVVVDTEYFADWFSPDNVRIVHTAWFADVSGGYLVEHWFNLHGHGAYDLKIVNGGPYNNPYD